MKRVWLLLLLALSVGLNVGLLYVQRSREPLPPQPPPEAGPPAPGPGRFDDLVRNHVDRMAEGLRLDEDQVRRLREVHRDLLPRMASVSRDLDELRRSVGDEYVARDLDAEQLRGDVARLSRTQATLASLVVEAMLAEAAILTPDQRERYARAMPWGRRGAPPPPPPR